MVNGGFQSLRLLALFSHFVSTTALFWTSDQCVHATLKPNFGTQEFDSTKAGYHTVISLGIIFLILNGFMAYLDQGKLRFKDVFSLGCDTSATFFNLWIILDGLGWDTYIYIFCFCVVIPFGWTAIHYSPYIGFYTRKYLRRFMYYSYQWMMDTREWCDYWYNRCCI